jgi:signal transduction histidine kinase
MTNEDTPSSNAANGATHSEQQAREEDSSAVEGALLAQLVPDAIRQRLLLKVLFGLVLVVLISGAIGVYMYQDISQSLKEDVETQIRATTTLHENAYENWFSDRRTEVVSVTESVDLAGTNYDRISIDLNVARVGSDYITELYLVDRSSGEVLASSRGNAIGDNITAIGVEQRWLQQREFVSPSPYESRNGYSALAFGADASEQNNVDRVLVAEVDTSEANLAAGEDPTIEQTIEGATTSVVTREGQRVIGEDVDVEVPTDLASGVGIQSTADEIRGYQRITGEPQFVVVTETPDDEAFALRNAVLRNFGLTLAVTFLILIGVTVVGSRLLARDLNVLVDRSKSLGSANLDVDLSTSRIDEIGVLYSEFDTMRRNLQDRMQQVRRSREELEQYNDQLDVLDRMLRHNLNNQMNVISLHARQIQNETTGDPAESAEKILKMCDSILTRVDKQRQITKTLSGDLERQPINVARLSKSAVRTIRERYPDATVHLDTPESVPALTTYAMEDAIIEVTENAVIHNDSAEKRVTIDITQEDETVVVEVTDNGPGIPQMEREIFEREQDIDPLNHSQGIGLWLVYWTVELSEGSLRFEDPSGGGSRVVIELPAATAAALESIPA